MGQEAQGGEPTSVEQQQPQKTSFASQRCEKPAAQRETKFDRGIIQCCHFLTTITDFKNIGWILTMHTCNLLHLNALGTRLAVKMLPCDLVILMLSFLKTWSCNSTHRAVITDSNFKNKVFNAINSKQIERHEDLSSEGFSWNQQEVSKILNYNCNTAIKISQFNYFPISISLETEENTKSNYIWEAVTSKCLVFLLDIWPKKLLHMLLNNHYHHYSIQTSWMALPSLSWLFTTFLKKTHIPYSSWQW